MAWETLQKSRGRLAAGKPPIWKEVPCVGIGKAAISFNDKFVEAFDFAVGDFILVMVDTENGKVGFKKAVGDERDGGWKFQRNTSNNQRGGTIACKYVGRKFPDRIGDTFRARLNHGERVIEVNLNGEA